MLVCDDRVITTKGILCFEQYAQHYPLVQPKRTTGTIVSFIQ